MTLGGIVHEIVAAVRGAPVLGLTTLIRIYQWTLSPLLGPCCRYLPTCSQYAIEALRAHGVFRGSLLAAWRVLRCHPYSRSGYDPVPPRSR